MKVIENPESVAPPVTIEFSGEERVLLARIMNTLRWSSLDDSVQTFLLKAYEALTDEYRLDADPIPGAKVNGR